MGKMHRKIWRSGSKADSTDEEASRLTVRTFHSLGRAIIGEAGDKLPTVAKVAEDDKALSVLLRDIVEGLLGDEKLSQILRRWFQEFFSPYRSQHEFRNWGEYWNYIREHEIRSLKGDKVKSFEECEIANFLYLNGVSYKYEAPYEHDTATSQRGQYKPDFHLPDAGIYIEHFALNASGNTPPFIDQEQYLASMEWKRDLHAEHGTILIETFSYEKAAGEADQEAVREAGGTRRDPVSHPLRSGVRRSAGTRKGRSVHNSGGDIPRSLQGCPAVVPRSCPAGGEGGRPAQGAGLPGRVRADLRALPGISLPTGSQIDFHDMINKATKHVEAGRFLSPFRYILVDEFQDISPGRARLLKALLDQSSDAQLFAVGDDWQSIYRFTGSDIAIMREFGDHFGHTEQTYLETTFRCADRIADVATKFVLCNPAQIFKKVRSTRRADGPSVHVGLPTEDLSLLEEALDMIGADAATHDETSTVLLLGRYWHRRPNDMPELGKRHPDLDLTYMTAHGSKGREADYVVVLGLRAGKYGFPTEITDDPLIDLVLPAAETHPHAEERRLFHVAMTRARRAVYLLAERGAPSSFVQELIDGSYDIRVFGRQPENDVSCPQCVTGLLVRRENRHDGSTFYGCSNRPYCDHTQQPCHACGQGLPVRTEGEYHCRDCGHPIEACPKCEGWLQTIRGIFGLFLGCSNWPACGYTRNIPG